ncbi:MAG: hypothetical protein R3C44_15000 [Chloroflexota bacterium]
MYLALASYAANNDRIVESLDDARPLMPFLEDLFLRQGFRPSSSSEPFEDYLVKGMGHSPLVMIYEAQFISSAAQENGGITSDMALMYPRPTIFLLPSTFSSHSVRPGSVGEAADDRPRSAKLAIEYALYQRIRPTRDYTSQHQVQIPDTIIDVIEPPTYEVLEGMIQIIEDKYEEIEVSDDNRIGPNLNH